MKNMEQMRINNGHFEQDGREYVLTQSAYIDGEEYTALAICLQDTADKDGWQPAYNVAWKIGDNDQNDECFDPHFDIDWDNPCSIVECGKYNIKDGIFF